ncbi:hypothetical protein [Nonomuraea sp. NPDC049695]|uniref:hypothetical protein n=1 Tax=Nonomuraea sp. NPDC049695 TaxID=3154734 RepID=UPI003414BE4E
MTYPEIIPISYEPDYRTAHIGQWRDGQFLGGVVAAFREGYSMTEDWQAHKRWYAILHRFNSDGHYLDSRIECTGADDRHRESVDAGDRRLSEWLAELPGLEFGDIAIRPFRLEFDGVVFGLILEDHGGAECAELYPDNLGFYAPWDGEYDT